MQKSVAGPGRVVGGAVLALLVGFAASCQTASSSRQALNHGDLHAKDQNLSEALAAFEKAASLATNDADRTRAYISMARVLIQQGEWSRAVNTLQRARSQYEGTDVPAGRGDGIVSEIYRVMGEAHFHGGNFVLARRYLEKGIAGSAGQERQLTLARLYACCLTVGERQMALAYQERLQVPASPAVRRIVANAPQLAKAYAAREKARTTPPPRRWAPLPPTPQPPPKTDDVLRTRPFSVLSRAHWRARAPRRNVTRMGKITRLTVHHAAGPEFWGTSKSASSAEIQRIQRFHQVERSWADIGYHFVVDRAGRVWRGRSLKHQGAHARGRANRGNIGVLLLGNLIRQEVTEPQKRSLEALVSMLTSYYSIRPYRVYPHREILQGKTDCPGPAVTRLVSRIRAALRRRELAAR